MTGPVEAEDQGAEVLSDAYALGVKAEALREAADAWDALGEPVAVSPVARWLRGRADQVEDEAGRLEDSVPRPAEAGGCCRVIDVDGAVRVQGGGELGVAAREAMVELVRAVRARSGVGGGRDA